MKRKFDRLKVLHINCNYLGSNEVHRTMISEFKKYGKNEYDVFVPVKKRFRFKKEKNVFVTNCIGDFDKYFYYYKQRKICKALKCCGLDVGGYNCVHAFTLFTDGGVANKIYRLYGIPYIVAVRDTDLNFFLKYKPYLKRRARTILEESSKIVFLSESYKRLLIKKLFNNGKYPFEDKTVILPNGVDDYWIKNIYHKKRDLDGSVLKAIFVGKINKRKNVILIKKALDLYNKRIGNMRLTVVGKVDDKRVFKKIKKDKNISYCGTKDKEQLLELYRNHDVYVMPSHTESFGMVYVEAMTQGLPLIYTMGQGFDKQFAEGVVGYHVSDKDPNSIIDALQMIVNSYSDICSNCVKCCLRFRWSNICKSYDMIYGHIAKEEVRH